MAPSVIDAWETELELWRRDCRHSGHPDANSVRSDRAQGTGERLEDTALGCDGVVAEKPRRGNEMTESCGLSTHLRAAPSMPCGRDGAIREPSTLFARDGTRCIPWRCCKLLNFGGIVGGRRC
mmetsp:Transcript_52538/g.139932  ORF Transcript_52538/g.139932 Transcript_52538/m.139932 type:complete len:123 (-) Transcript_52538:548-916(-)